MEDTQIDKQKRYDRQLRIWGQQGQQLLEKSKICLVTACPAGTETLKNLILGGIGSFLVIDKQRVTNEDLGNNFYVTKSGLGKSRAAEVVDLLQELNENVPGSFLEMDIEEILQHQQQALLDCDVIVLTQVTEEVALQVDQLCRKHAKKIINVVQFGLYGYIQISSEEQFQIHQHLENIVEDLRLTDPWTELLKFVDSIDMEKCEDVIHKHTPYAVILIKVLQQYKQQNNGKQPRTTQEKRDFKAIIQSRRRKGVDEENFQEALDQAKKIFFPTQIPKEVYDLFEDPAIENLNNKSPHFRFLVAALKKFVNSFQSLPLEGSLPDMTSTTEMYVQLQKLYKTKAEEDAKILGGYVEKLLQSVGLDKNAISWTEIKNFAKNSSQIAAISYPHFPQPISPSSPTPSNGSNGANSYKNLKSQQIKELLEEELGPANVSVYVTLRAVDLFKRLRNRYPGTKDEEVENDKQQLKQYCLQTAYNLQIPYNSIIDEYIDEACRSGPIQIHNVGAILGGIAAQEIIKLVTLQFKPLDGVMVYNGILQSTSVLNL